ncbi:IS3 family transposase [Prauserella sp. PE36]|uniref:IS3 family transposase n=1 Tax=Prauserella sp. PE36 TaxID=1504709 RepID=UPI00131455FE|nr:IS3 family transposase [Prauserella sp. PE36]
MVFDYIDGHRERVVEGKKLGVEPICAVLKESGVQIAPRTYWAARKRAPSKRVLRDAELLTEIERVFRENYSVYGARKVYAQLNREGIRVARCTVERLMRQKGLQGLRRGRRPRTTIAAASPSSADLVGRRFTADRPNQLWVADITYIRTFSGWVYAAFVIDVFSRMVVGWQVSTSLHTNLALDALEMGIWARKRAGQCRARRVRAAQVPRGPGASLSLQRVWPVGVGIWWLINPIVVAGEWPGSSRMSTSAARTVAFFTGRPGRTSLLR